MRSVWATEVIDLKRTHLPQTARAPGRTSALIDRSINARTLPMSGCLARWRFRQVPTAGERPGARSNERVYVLARRYSHRVRGPIDIPSDQFVILDGVRFHYLDWGGDGEPMLLLAGLGSTAHVFSELAPQLSDRFRVLALTRRGHGLTDQVHSGYALADAAEDARRLLDAT